jgi:hypothetical protein
MHRDAVHELETPQILHQTWELMALDRLDGLLPLLSTLHGDCMRGRGLRTCQTAQRIPIKSRFPRLLTGNPHPAATFSRHALTGPGQRPLASVHCIEASGNGSEGQKARAALWAIATVDSSTGSIRAKASRFVGQCEQRCGRLRPLFKRPTRAGGNRARTDRGITQLRQHKRGRPSNYNSQVAWAICMVVDYENIARARRITSERSRSRRS